jgi:hypothetical protein
MAAEDRSKKLKRLVAVQRQVEKMAEVELADTTRHRTKINESMDHLLDALGSVEPIHQMFSKQYSEQYSRLRTRDSQLAGMQQFQENKVLREKTKADRLQDRFKQAREHEDREKDDNAIFDLLEVIVTSHDPASSKLGGS